MEKKLKFEDAMERLNEIVKTLEGGTSSLDDSISLFEEGMKISKYCSDLLKNAEQKVKIIQSEGAGNDA